MYVQVLHKGILQHNDEKTSKKGPLIMTERSTVSLAVCRDSGDTGGGLVVINCYLYRGREYGGGGGGETVATLVLLLSTGLFV